MSGKNRGSLAKHAVEVGREHGTVSQPHGSRVAGTEFTSFRVDVPEDAYNALELEARITHDADVTPAIGNISIFQEVSPTHKVHVSVWKR